VTGFFAHGGAMFNR